MDRKILLENLERSIRTYDGFDGRFKVFTGKRPFKWKYNDEAGVPLIYLHPPSEGPISDNDVLGQLMWPFFFYYIEISSNEEALQTAEHLYAQKVQPLIDGARGELETLLNFMKDIEIKRTGKIERMIKDLGQLEAQTKSMAIYRWVKKAKKIAEERGLLKNTGALQRLRVNLYNVLRACTNLTRDDTITHVVGLLSHCGIEENIGNPIARVRKSVIGKRYKKTRKEMSCANFKLMQYRTRSWVRAMYSKTKIGDKSK